MCEGKTMTHDEMMKIIEEVDRCELDKELEELRLVRKDAGYSRYLKAVRSTLVAFGYDYKWVDMVFRTALEDYYNKRMREYGNYTTR